MKSTKLALVGGSALIIALAGAAVNADPEGPRGPDFACGMGPGYHMGYGMGPGYHMGYGMGPGNRMGYGPGPGYHMGYGMGFDGAPYGQPGAVDERLDALRSTLAITDSQQDAWRGFAESVKKQTENRQAWFDKMHGSQTARTTPDWIAQRNEAMKQQQVAGEAVATALKKLYDVLTPEQRVVLDRGPVASAAGRGWCGR